MIPITVATILAMNAGFADLPLTEQRAQELEVEVGQLRAVAETLRQQLAFASEPADFTLTLQRLAETRHV